METSLIVLLAGLFNFFAANATFEELAANPAEYIRGEGTFRDGIAVCIDISEHPARILATYRPERPSDKTKLILVKTRAETVTGADIRPGSMFIAEGRVEGKAENREQQFWIEARSLENTGQVRGYTSYPVSCSDLLGQVKEGKRKVPWAIAAIATTLGYGSGILLGEILTNNPATP